MDKISKVIETVVVNAVVVDVVVNWQSIVANVLQIILVVTAIIYNSVRIYSWYKKKRVD